MLPVSLGRAQLVPAVGEEKDWHLLWGQQVTTHCITHAHISRVKLHWAEYKISPNLNRKMKSYSHRIQLDWKDQQWIKHPGMLLSETLCWHWRCISPMKCAERKHAACCSLRFETFKMWKFNRFSWNYTDYCWKMVTWKKNLTLIPYAWVLSHFSLKNALTYVCFFLT